MHLFLFIRRDFLAAKYRFSNRLAGLPDAGHSCPLQPWVILYPEGPPQRHLLDGNSFQAQRGSRDRALPCGEYKYLENIFTPRGLSFIV